MLRPSPPMMFGIFERSLTRRLASSGIAVSFLPAWLAERAATERDPCDADPDAALASGGGSVSEVVPQVERNQLDVHGMCALHHPLDPSLDLVRAHLQPRREKRSGGRAEYGCKR